MKQIETWLSGRSQRILITATDSSWMPVNCGVSQGSRLGPLLSNLSINDLDEGPDASSAIC